MVQRIKSLLWVGVLILCSSLLLSSPVAAASKVDLDINAPAKFINSLTIQIGQAYFYSGAGSNTLLAGNTNCPASIKYDSGAGYTLIYSTKQSGGACSSDSSKPITVDANSIGAGEVFAQYKGDVVSVKPDIATPFKRLANTSTFNPPQETYVQAVDPTACPSIIVQKSPGEWRLIPMATAAPGKEDAEVNSFFKKAFGKDTKCRTASGDLDPISVLNYYGIEDMQGTLGAFNDIGLGGGVNSSVYSVKLRGMLGLEGVGVSGAGPNAGVYTLPQTPGTGADKETCTVAGIGWIVCPLMTFIGKAVDAAYSLIEQMMIFTVQDPFGNNPLKQIWGNILGIANVVFVVAFFIVIFSQATNVGINNYGIKKMLPRMIAAAILVNLSYYICIFAIDLSNIIGAGIDGILMSALPTAQSANLSWSTVIVGALAGTLITATIAIAPMAVVALIAPFAGTALLAVITTLVILVARQAILIMLIVLSPLAFVAFILPGTADWFDKWRKTFISMLVFYPLVAILFSGSKVAAYIMQQANNGGVVGALIQVFALGVMTFPLFGTPFLLKISGGLIGRIAGIVNNPNKGPFDRLNKWGRETADRTRGAAANDYDSNPATRSKYKNFRSRLVTGTPFLGVSASSRARSRAEILQRGDSYGAEERKIAAASFSARGISGDKDELYRIATTSRNQHEQVAAMLQLGEIGAADKLEDLYRGERNPATGVRMPVSVDQKKAAAAAISASAAKLTSTANPLFFDAATYQSQVKQGRSETDATNQADKVRRQKVTSLMGANYLKNLRADQIAGARQSILELGAPGDPEFDAAVGQVEATINSIGSNSNTLNDMTDEQIVEIGKMAERIGISSSSVHPDFVKRYNTAATSIAANKPAPSYDPIPFGPGGVGWN